MTGRPHADFNNMLAARFQTEGVVESGNLVNAAVRNAQRFSRDLQSVLGKIIEGSLNILQHGNQRAFIAAVFFNN